MARDRIGLCACPECGEDAEIKETKSALAYRWCPSCFAQYFPKKYPQSDRLKATARPGTATGRYVATVPEPEQQKTATPEPVREPEPKPKAARREISIF